MVLARFLLSLLLVSSSLHASEDFGFPLGQENGSACLDAAQKWIKREMLSPSKESPGKAYAFNTAFSKCLWETKEAKEIKWPSSYQELKDPSTLSYPLKDSEGNWVIVTARPFSESYTQTFLLIKKDGTTKAFSGPNIKGHFAGIETRPYELNSKTQAIEVLSAYVSEYGPSISSTFIGLDHQTFLQTTKESVSKNPSTKLLVHRVCKHSVEHDSRNVFGKIIEDCGNEKKVFQWNGVQYREEEPEEWLTQLKAKPKPKTIIVATKKISAVKKMGPLSYVTVTQTQKPKGQSGSATRGWFLLKDGADKKVLALINESIKKLSVDQNIFLIESDGPPFGTSSGSITPDYFAHNVLTVKMSSYSEAPESRSFDSATHLSFDLRTGMKIDLETSFKTFQDKIHFHLWVWNQLKKNSRYVFPYSIRKMNLDLSTSDFTVLFKEKTLEILLEDDTGGHDNTESLGEIPYELIPKKWFKEDSVFSYLAKGSAPQDLFLRPVMDCTSEDEVLKKICSFGLQQKYEEFLLNWERRLEEKVKSQEDLDKLIEDFGEFQTKFQSCSERTCVEKIMTPN